MNARAGHYLHELGQVFLCDAATGIFLALQSENADPAELPYAWGALGERYEEAVMVGEWLEREIAEGRATAVEHYFTVDV